MDDGLMPILTELATHGTHALVRNNAMRELFSRDSSNPTCATTMYVAPASMDDGRDVATWREWLRKIRAW